MTEEADGPKRYMRSRQDKVLGGVCGGLAEYFEIDPTLVRVLWVLLVLVTGFVPGVLVYILLWALAPEA